MRREHLIFLVLGLTGSVVLAVVLTLTTLSPQQLTLAVPVLRPRSVVVLHLHGVITYEAPPLAVSPVLTPERVRELLERAESLNPGALVIVLTSSGGSPGASYEIYCLLRNFAEKHNVSVVVYVPEEACSGGYMVALAADKIVVSPYALVGSIGAVAQLISVKKLLEMLGIEVVIVKSGKYKDVGAITKEITREDIRYVKRLVREVFEEFKKLVLERRGEKLRNLTQIFSAQVFLGEEAVSVGLADEVGDLSKAIEIARELAHLPPTAPVHYVRERPRVPLPLLPQLSTELLIQKLLTNLLQEPVYLRILLLSSLG